MTGKHSPGYLAAYAAATREAARRFREDNPDEWAHILQRHVLSKCGEPFDVLPAPLPPPPPELVRKGRT